MKWGSLETLEKNPQLTFILIDVRMLKIIFATADVKAVASKAAGLGSARGILNPGYDYYHQPGKSLVPR